MTHNPNNSCPAYLSPPAAAGVIQGLQAGLLLMCCICIIIIIIIIITRHERRS
jgi:hypothetical protein